MRIEADSAAGRIVVEGDIDVANAYDLYLTAVSSGSSPTVTLDLRAVSFIDSVGLGMIIRARDELHAVGKHLVLSRPSKVVSDILDLTALTGQLTIE